MLLYILLNVTLYGEWWCVVGCLLISLKNHVFCKANHAEAHCNLEPSQTSLHCFFCILDHEISSSTFYILPCVHQLGHHTFARFHRLAPWKNVSIRIKLDFTAQQFTSSLQGASTNQQEGKDHANLGSTQLTIDIKCVHETVWRLSNLVKLLSFRVSSRENVKIWMTDLQHWDGHPHSTLCMWKVPVCWHGCCLCARPGSRCGAIEKNQKQRSWLVRTWTEPCCLHIQGYPP